MKIINKLSPSGGQLHRLLAMTFCTVISYNSVVSAENISMEDRIYFSVEKFCNNEQYDKAVADLERVLKLNPMHPGALFHLGMFEYKNLNHTRANKLLSKIRDNPEFGSRARKMISEMKISSEIRGIVDSVKAYISGGAVDSAYGECRKAVPAYPAAFELFFYAAFTAALNDDFSEAEKFFAKYKELHSENSEDLKNFIHCWKIRKDTPRETLIIFNQIADKRLAADFVREEIHKLIAEKEGGDEYENFLIAETARGGEMASISQQKLVKLYMSRNEFQKAIDILESRSFENLEDNILYINALTLAGNEVKAMAIGKALFYSGKKEEQINIRTNWLKAFNQLSEKNRSPYLPEKETAEKAFEALMAYPADPENHDVAVTMLETSVILGEQKMIHQSMERIFTVSINKEISEKILNLSDKLSESKFSEESLSLLEGILAQSPEDTNIIKSIAKKYTSQGRTNDALILLESAVKTNPESITTFFMYIEALNMSGQSEKAKELMLQKLDEPNLPELAINQLKNRLND
ncbi:MAG: hypothetical protein HQM10_14855 [Candidatus Riflebacteria bacterium]|nr:hypothetical protein [Candidatus Riflebacteria bacterium]